VSGETRRLGPGAYLLDGEKVVSVSTVKGNWPKPGLTKWAANTCGAYAADHWEWLTHRPAMEAQSLIAGAPWRDLQAAGVRGTKIHTFAQRVTLGAEVEIPEDYAGYVEAAVKFLDEWQPTEERIETSVFSRKHKYAGTFDLMCMLPGLGLALLDYKTGRKGPYGDTALQLAGYGNAEFMLIDGIEVPMPPIDFYGVIWPHADGTYDLYPFTVTERTFRLFLYVQQTIIHKDFIEREAKGFAIPPPRAATEVPA